MNTTERHDLSNRTIVVLISFTVVFFIVCLIFIDPPKPGTLTGQGFAAVGSLLLLLPFLFSVLKRSNNTTSPPLWFVIHVISALSGSLLIILHVMSGNWLTPPGVVFFLLSVLILQGGWMRCHLSQRLSYLFARNSTVDGFLKPFDSDTAKIQKIIDKKCRLLELLDSDADEALFSPSLKHWCRHPFMSFQYQSLAEREATLIGARQQTGFLLQWSRRFHLLIAFAFLSGLLTHVITVLFFAGYVAGDNPVTWWHVTDWGR